MEWNALDTLFGQSETVKGCVLLVLCTPSRETARSTHTRLGLW